LGATSSPGVGLASGAVVADGVGSDVWVGTEVLVGCMVTVAVGDGVIVLCVVAVGGKEVDVKVGGGEVGV